MNAAIAPITATTATAAPIPMPAFAPPDSVDPAAAVVDPDALLEVVLLVEDFCDCLEDAAGELPEVDPPMPTRLFVLVALDALDIVELVVGKIAVGIAAVLG
ncbi:hypothetical protein CMQ_2697 [Grosmannia clavigera kw1407]|uniref:Uncharacterized protein n=1 Tax=Grosmannia clavigera (strain kw1407 / UAMH 11150) TaxID=655863 RepID=F0XHQ8_GROCL|nr:uncharacterized protein CMQ_2697 [Grosmannia clavigera kw1407]EFX02768.1 hypothetical protein CMQ_2697 [Grosmannia clavigera kw1407]